MPVQAVAFRNAGAAENIVIEVHNLTFAYPKTERPAIREMDFRVRPGEVFGFLGPSGSGKSTTQKILIGLLKGYSGRVDLFGKPLNRWGADLYERIGVSFEFPNHFLKLTGLENLSYFRRLYKGRTEDPGALLEQVGLERDGDLFVSQYSKGMKNRLSLARALLHESDLLFLDEPTAGLDPINAVRVKKLIQSHKEAGKTVFLTTHDMTVADELCDEVALIAEGSIRVIDVPRELKLRWGKPLVRVGHGASGAVAFQDFPLEGLGDNPAFLELLKTGSVQTVHSLEATLEQVFIEVTGRSLS